MFLISNNVNNSPKKVYFSYLKLHNAVNNILYLKFDVIKSILMKFLYCFHLNLYDSISDFVNFELKI